MMVVIYHMGAMVRGSTIGYMRDFHFLEMGVDIFFVISGFIMVQSNLGRDRSPLSFWWLRLVRIAPTAWLATTAMIVVFVLGFRPAGLQAFDAGDVIGSYTFLPVQRADGVESPIVTPAWTLVYEMFFYLIFGAGLLLKPMRATLIFVTVVLGALVVGGALVDFDLYALEFYTRPILIEFLAGCGLGVWFSREPVRAPWKPWLAVAMMAAGFAIPALAEASGWTWQSGAGASRTAVLGPCAVMIVLGALMLERSGIRARSPAVAMMGDTSYALYLFHMLVAHAAAKVVAPLLEPWRDAPWTVSVMVVALVAISVLASVLIFYLYEKPVTTWLRSLGRSPPGDRTPGLGKIAPAGVAGAKA